MALSAPRHLGDGTMSLPRSVRLIWWVTWFNVRMLLVSEFFVLLTFVSPLIFATLAFFLFRLGHSTGGQTLLYAALALLIVAHVVPYGFPFAVIVYYLVWKHIVGRLNAIIGIA